MNTVKINPLINPLITLAAIAGFIYLLIIQKALFVPLALGLFLALLLLKPVQRLEKWRIPRILANLIMILAALLVIAGISALIGYTLSQFIGDMPQYQSTIQTNLVSLQEVIARISGVPVADQKVWLDQNLNLLELGARNVGNIITGASAAVTTLALTFIYSFFILYYRDKIRVFLQKLLGGRAEEEILAVMKKVAKLVPRYLTGLLLAMAILAIINSAGLAAIGIHNAIFWGMIIAVLNVIPYVGTVIGFGALVIFTLVTQGVPLAIGALVLFLATQFIDNNFLTPMIAGGNIDINPLAAIIGLIVIGSIWGVIGLVLALPIIGMIKIVADSIERYRAFGYLLGTEGTEEHAVTWENIRKFFRRKKA